MTLSGFSDTKEKHITMKSSTILKLLFSAVLIISCSKDAENGNRIESPALKSKICENITGPTAAYWDLSHQLPIPITELPLIKNPGQRFVHSQSPLIGVTVPQGYTATEVTNFQTGTMGVNVQRNDNAVVWRYVPIGRQTGQVPINDIMASEINQMFSFYGFNGSPEVLCTTTGTDKSAAFLTQFGARLLKFGGVTGLVWANAHFSPSTGVTFISVSVSSAPSNEFDREVMETFIPMSWQLLVDLDRGVTDNDGDGVPAHLDRDDNDPNVS